MRRWTSPYLLIGSKRYKRTKEQETRSRYLLISGKVGKRQQQNLASEDRSCFEAVAYDPDLCQIKQKGPYKATEDV
jgi:hypothetical protein